MPGHNLITDLTGIRVGHADNDVLISGVTAILFDQPAMAAGVTRGGAPGTRDTVLLEPEMMVEGIDAVVLSGGSLFGLDAAGGVVNYLRGKGVGMRLGSVNVPIAVQAITFDLLNGGDKDWGRQPPYWDLGWQAAEAAQTGPFALGSVGGGMGATTATLKGGLGSASAMTTNGFRVGAIAVVNAIGTVTIGNGREFWAAPVEVGREFGGRGMPATFPREALELRMKGGVPPSTTIALVATDAMLTKPEVKRLAIMADDGLARAVRPAHAPMDGDTVFAAALQQRPLHNRVRDITELGLAAADCLARAIARGVYEARRPCAAYAGPPAYGERFPPDGA